MKKNICLAIAIITVSILISSCSKQIRFPNEGLFYMSDGNLHEIQRSNTYPFGITINDPVINNDMTVLYLKYPDINFNTLVLSDLHRNVQVPFTIEELNNGGYELSPRQQMDDGEYCLIIGDSFSPLKNLTRWCFIIGDQKRTNQANNSDDQQFNVAQAMTGQMSQGLLSGQQPGVWYGVYKYLDFPESDANSELEVLVESGSNQLRIELWDGKIDPGNDAWWTTHTQVVVSTGTGANPQLEINPALRWRIVPGTYTLFFATFNPSGNPENFPINYTISKLE